MPRCLHNMLRSYPCALPLILVLLLPPPSSLPPPPSIPSPTAASVLKGSFSLPNVSYTSGLLDPRSTNYTSLASLIRTQVRHEYRMLFTSVVTPSHSLSPPHPLTIPRHLTTSQLEKELYQFALPGKHETEVTSFSNK